MPRYFFPSSDGLTFVPDEDGVELGSVEDARVLATRAVVEMAADALPRAQDGRVFRVGVLGSDHQVLLDVSLTFGLVTPM
jgi:hypothetical protein